MILQISFLRSLDFKLQEHKQFKSQRWRMKSLHLLLCSLKYSKTDVHAQSLYIAAGGGPAKAMGKLAKKFSVLRAIKIEATFHYFFTS